LRLGT